MQKPTLFCIPFSGGSFYSYRELEKSLSHAVKVAAVDMPGHGRRMGDPLLTDAYEIAEDLLTNIKAELGEPYAIYGHSLGAKVTYLLAKKIVEKGYPRPRHLFVSGSGGPPTRIKEKDLYLLPKQEFFDKMREYGGTPEEVLAEGDLMDFMEPILRADFQAVGTYEYKNGLRLDIPITVMIGSDDNVTRSEALTWQEVTTREIAVRQFPGGHFFIFDHLTEISSIICQELEKAGVG
ncbi:alpha/beta fold hydrolase [Desulfococcaceae bacterium HSG8]|nr:alpha/beta fold hydrolase [Desulfococcaceae bacterium HSG8]